MKISKAKIIYYLATFRKGKAAEYLLECANNWVNAAMSDATKAGVTNAFATGKKVLEMLNRYSWVCPEKWRTAYTLTTSAFEDLICACDDLTLEIAEIEKVANSFKVAYAEWCAE